MIFFKKNKLYIIFFLIFLLSVALPLPCVIAEYYDTVPDALFLDNNMYRNALQVKLVQASMQVWGKLLFLQQPSLSQNTIDASYTTLISHLIVIDRCMERITHKRSCDIAPVFDHCVYVLRILNIVQNMHMQLMLVKTSRQWRVQALLQRIKNRLVMIIQDRLAPC